MQTGRPGLASILVWIYGLCLLATGLVLPTDQWTDRIIFFEDACWSISWIIIALASFRGKKAGFPPAVISITLAVEVYLFIHYSFLSPWPYHPWFLINYLLWPFGSCLNLYCVYRFSRDEFVPGGEEVNFFLRTATEAGFYFMVFLFLARSLPDHLVMVYFGQAVILLISLQFLLLLLYRKDLQGQSLWGNIFRSTGGILCYYLNGVVKESYLGADAFLSLAMPLVVFLDLTYLTVFFYRKNQLRIAS